MKRIIFKKGIKTIVFPMMSNLPLITETGCEYKINPQELSKKITDNYKINKNSWVEVVWSSEYGLKCIVHKN